MCIRDRTTATATPSLFEATLSLHYYYKSSNPLSFLKIADYNAVDSDGDGCDDVVEAGFIDGNSTAVSGDADFFNKGMLGTNTPTVDSDGLVTSAVGYLTPTDSNANSQFDFQENTPAPSIVVSPVSQYICLGDNAQFTVTAGYSNSAYQWQINSGGIWNNLTNTGIYSGVTSSSLTLTNPSFSLDTQEYRVIVSIPEYILSLIHI